MKLPAGLCSPLIFSPPLAHLGCEDTDAVHPHQSHWQTFTETSSRSVTILPVGALSRLLLSAISLRCLSISASSFLLPSISLSSLSHVPLHLSFGCSSQGGLLRLKHVSRPATPPPALAVSSCCLRFMAAGSHMLTSERA